MSRVMRASWTLGHEITATITSSAGTNGAFRTRAAAATVAQISIGIAANSQTRRSVMRPASPRALAPRASGTETASQVAE